MGAGRTNAPRGKRSRGCARCRERRIKCGEEQPECLRCVRSGLRCPGPVNESVHFFHNENIKSVAQWYPPPSPEDKRSTQSTVVQIDGASDFDCEEDVDDCDSLSHTSSSTSVSSSKALVPHRNYTFLPPNSDIDAYPDVSMSSYASLPPQVRITSNQKIVDLFYASGLRKFQTPSREAGMLEGLIPLWLRCPADATSSSALRALSYMCLAKDEASPVLMRDSLVEYSRAIAVISRALETSAVALSEGVILNVITLMAYEILAGDEGSLGRYEHHLTGAYHLLTQRQKKNRHDVFAKNMARAICPQMITLSIQQAKPMQNVDLHPAWAIEIGGVSYGSRHDLEHAISGIAALRQLAETLLPPTAVCGDPNAVASLRARALAIDQKLEHFAAGLPPSDPATKLWVEADKDYDDADVCLLTAWPGAVHTYSSVTMAGVLTRFDVCRMILLSIIGRCDRALATVRSSTKMDDADLATLRAGEDTIRHLADKICSAIPFMLGLSLDTKTLTSPRLDGRRGRDSSGGGGLLQSWTLFVVASMDCVPSRQREWARQTMLHISSAYGIGCAGAMARYAGAVSFTGRGPPIVPPPAGDV